MKSLTKELLEQSEISTLDSFDKEILKHIAIDYKEGHTYSRFHLVLEKYGIYDGLNELVEYIYKDVLKMMKDDSNSKGFVLDYTKNELKGFKNIYFENLHIDIDLVEAKGGEYEANTELNNDTLLFDDVYINVHTTNYKEVPHNLKHELTHGYNNYMLLLKNDNRFERIIDSGVYSKIVIDDNLDQIHNDIKEILYLTLDVERNAFIAQISDALRKHKEKISTPLDALNVLKKTKPYKEYKRLLGMVQSYKLGRLGDEVVEIFTNEYNDICGTKLTANKVFKKLDFLLTKANKKLDSNIGKLCLENLNNTIWTSPSKLFLNS